MQLCTIAILVVGSDMFVQNNLEKSCVFLIFSFILFFLSRLLNVIVPVQFINIVVPDRPHCPRVDEMFCTGPSYSTISRQMFKYRPGQPAFREIIIAKTVRSDRNLVVSDSLQEQEAIKLLNRKRAGSEPAVSTVCVHLCTVRVRTTDLYKFKVQNKTLKR